MLNRPRLLPLFAVALVGVVGASSAAAQVWVERQKLVASDGEPGDEFGSVAIEGDLALVGATGDDDNGTDAGAVYVFRFDGDAWVEEQKLLASDGRAGDGFGTVALAAGMALVGARYHDLFFPGDVEYGAGAVYVFAFDGVEWVETQKLVPSDHRALQGFGGTVLASGDTALVGGPGAGSPLGGGSAPDASWAYRFDGTHWVEEGKLAGEMAALAGDAALSLDVEWGEDCPACRAIPLRLYRFDGAEWGLDGSFLGNKPLNVGIWEDLIVYAAGSNQAIGMLAFDGTDWIHGPTLVSEGWEPDERPERRIALGDDVIAVTNPSDGEGGEYSGAAHVFSFDGLEWFERQKLVASDGMSGDHLGRGYNVSALWADRLLVGARQALTSAGTVYFFEATGPSVELKIGGAGAVYPHAVVETDGPLTLTLDMKAGPDVLDHYYFWWTDGTFYWITADGVSDTPAPIASLAPVDLTTSCSPTRSSPPATGPSAG